MNKLVHFKIALTFITAFLFAGCTAQVPSSFRFLQQNEIFGAPVSLNTKIDLLWVIDNSASMDVSQAKLRAGLAQFAQKYMKPTWDIQIAAIPSDIYIAHAAFDTYVGTTVPNSTGYHSNYIASRLGNFQNPSWNPNLVNLSTGNFDSGFKFGDLEPLWRRVAGVSSYAKLLPGVHDGPTTAFCFEPMPYFYNGITNCSIRDNQYTYNGTGSCLNPNSGLSETSENQCINTLENDTMRSGKAIIKTKPPTGTPGDQAWIDGIVRDFTINSTTGSAGAGAC